MTRLGITQSWGGWSITGESLGDKSIGLWSYEGVALSHIGTYGPGIWISDAYGICGRVQGILPSWGAGGFNPFNPGGIAAHHIAAGVLGTIAGVFHITNPPPEVLFLALRMANIETVLSSSIAAVFFAGFVTSGTMWYGAAATPIELFGSTRYQ
eukprot:12431519-Karenia_brevis.AAC.1